MPCSCQAPGCRPLRRSPGTHLHALASMARASPSPAPSSCRAAAMPAASAPEGVSTKPFSWPPCRPAATSMPAARSSLDAAFMSTYRSAGLPASMNPYCCSRASLDWAPYDMYTCRHAAGREGVAWGSGPRGRGLGLGVWPQGPGPGIEALALSSSSGGSRGGAEGRMEARGSSQAGEGGGVEGAHLLPRGVALAGHDLELARHDVILALALHRRERPRRQQAVGRWGSWPPPTAGRRRQRGSGRHRAASMARAIEYRFGQAPAS